MTQGFPTPGVAEGADPRPPYLWAALAGGLVFALYAVTLAPTTAFWDTSEYIATGHIMGIPHPPGNPLFVVLARAWSILLEPLGLSVAVRINLFSAFMSAGAHAFWFLVIHHVLRFFSPDRTFRLVGAGVAVLVSSTAFTVWNQSNVNEKVYTVSLLTIALLSWLAIRWQERLGKGKDDNLLVLMVFILALSVGNHLMAFLAAPAIGVFILLVRPGVLTNWKLYPAGVVALLLGLSIHLFLPLRAEDQPVINEGAPECPDVTSALVSVATYGNAGCAPLNESLTREQYKVEGAPGPGLFGERQAPVGAQLTNDLQYFDWQWARSVGGEDTTFPLGRTLFTMLFVALGVWGAMEHYQRDPKSFAYVATLFATLSLGLVWSLNFKYGYSFPQESLSMQEVRERDYFYIVSFSVWGLWAGVGLSAVWLSLTERFGGGDRSRGLRRASPVLLLAFLPFILNFTWADRSYDYAARDWAYNLLLSVEPYGLLFTNGDNDTFPLWYLQEVEGIRRDVTVVVTSYLNTPWYAKQIRGLTRPCPPGTSASEDPTLIICQRLYSAENTDAEYTADPEAARARGKIPLVLESPVTVPSRGILALEDEVIDEVAGSYVPLEAGRTFDLGPVQASLPAGSYLMPWQQFALSMISSSLGDRPVYFASSGSSAASLGLERYLVRQGLAYKLNPGPLDPASPPPGVVAMPASSPLNAVTGDWVNVPRTRTLVEEVFVHRSDLPAWDHWPDHSTVGIPNYYAWAYYALAQAAAMEDDQDQLETYRSLGERWSVLGR
ncbi:MAG: DUF2723 domain-containing protein [Gemmatimonadota bacterium]